MQIVKEIQHIYELLSRIWISIELALGVLCLISFLAVDKFQVCRSKGQTIQSLS